MKTVLVVEDDDDLREVIAHILGCEGYRVMEASNGLEALATIKSAEPLPDLVLLDLMMPVLSGSEVLHTLRADGGTASLPVIVLSAIADRHKPSGANAYLQKPLSRAELLGALHPFLGA